MDYISASAPERVKRWPFLRFRRAKRNEDVCWDDCLEKGWRIAFGEMMWDEIKAELVENNELNRFFIEDLKEKWGEMRLYFSCGAKSADKVHRIVDKYTELSRHICIFCGRPDVRFSTGWIYPACKNCYAKIPLTKDWPQERIDESYEKTFSKENRMSDWLRWTSRDASGKEVDRAFWIKETADKIRMNWKENHEKEP